MTQHHSETDDQPSAWATLQAKELDDCSLVQAELDRLVALAATLCHRPMALISLCQDTQLRLVAQQGWVVAPYGYGSHTFAPDVQVQTTQRSLQIGDLARLGALRRSPYIGTEPRIRAYSGIPLVGERFGLIGVLSVLDGHPQPVDGRTLDILKLVGHEIVGLVGDRPADPSWRSPPSGFHAADDTPPADCQEHLEHLELLQRLTQDLLMGASLQKAGTVLAQVLPRLFPRSSGWILLCDRTCQVFESLALWGAVSYRSDCLLAKHCLGLQHSPDLLTRATQACSTCHDATHPVAHCCIPLRIFDQTIGILSLRFSHISEVAPDVSQLAADVARHLSLLLHTLRRLDSLEQETLQDPLTGLYNRRHMVRMLANMLHRAQYGNSSVAIILVDIDYFKRFNDTYGHLAGDQVLRDFSVFLKGFIRSTDLACRYGGEEFLLLLSNADKATAQRRAERLRHDTRYLTMTFQGKSLGNITVSSGVAAFPEDGKTCDELIWAADMALYRAKSFGRDRVEVAMPKDTLPSS